MSDGWRVTKISYHCDNGQVYPAQDLREPRVLAETVSGCVMAHGRDILFVDDGDHSRWTHTCAGTPREAFVSGDRVLVTTDSLEYHAWGFLGPVLLLDIGSGSVVAELRGDRAAALPSARFVVGLEGYDNFDTWLHDRDGTLLTTWRSYGHYVVDPDGSIRVVECDRLIPTRSRVVRLRLDGVIERGPQLVSGQVSKPAVLEDGTIIVVDAGVLRAVNRDLDEVVLAELLPIVAEESWRFAGELTCIGNQLTVSMVERSDHAPVAYCTHRWSFELTQQPR